MMHSEGMTTTLTLTEFLRARLDDDYERADFVRRQNVGPWNTPFEDWRLSWHDEYDLLCIEPSRALAEVGAKRRIVELHEGGGHECSVYDHNGERDGFAYMQEGEDCSTLRLVALPYADHPDYREEWRP